MKIAIDNNIIKKSGKKIKECSSNISKDINNFNNVIDKINLTWTDNESTNSINKMRDSYIYKLKELCDDLDKYGEYLKNIPDAYEILDETFSNKNIDI